MGILTRWAALAGLAAAAGAGAAVAATRRRQPAAAPALAGVDGLGEPARVEEAPPAAPAVSHDEDAIAALDAARERLRRRADDLRREIDAGG